MVLAKRSSGSALHLRRELICTQSTKHSGLKLDEIADVLLMINCMNGKS